MCNVLSYEFMKLTAIIEEGTDGWLVGQIAEYPAAVSQGKTIDELRQNLADALLELLASYREDTIAEHNREGHAFTTTDLFIAHETERPATASA